MDFSEEKIFSLIIIIISLVGSFLILKRDFKHYGILYVTSSLTGIILCYLFIFFGFYNFPGKLIEFSPIPLLEMITGIPFYVIFGVRFSPLMWVWKIPFYWGLVHVAMFLEVITLYEPMKIIEYKGTWDVWDSYTWWWIFLLIFEWIGGKIVPNSSRNPIQSKSFRYGRWAWIIFHFVVITTIFMAGVYVGWRVK